MRPWDYFRIVRMGNKKGSFPPFPFSNIQQASLKDQGTGGPPGLKIGSLKPPSGAAISPQNRSHQLVVNHRPRFFQRWYINDCTVATTSHHLPKQRSLCLVGVSLGNAWYLLWDVVGLKLNDHRDGLHETMDCTERPDETHVDTCSCRSFLQVHSYQINLYNFIYLSPSVYSYLSISHVSHFFKLENAKIHMGMGQN